MITLAIDHGEKNIGLAVSDETGFIAAALPYIKAKTRLEAIEGILFVANDIKAEQLLLGLPTGHEGVDSPQTKKVRDFAEELKHHTDLPVTFWDETYSTKLAEKLNKANSHSEAARIILQEYLDFKRTGI